MSRQLGDAWERRRSDCADCRAGSPGHPAAQTRLRLPARSSCHRPPPSTHRAASTGRPAKALDRAPERSVHRRREDRTPVAGRAVKISMRAGDTGHDVRHQHDRLRRSPASTPTAAAANAGEGLPAAGDPRARNRQSPSGDRPPESASVIAGSKRAGPSRRRTPAARRPWIGRPFEALAAPQRSKLDARQNQTPSAHRESRSSSRRSMPP